MCLCAVRGGKAQKSLLSHHITLILVMSNAFETILIEDDDL